MKLRYAGALALLVLVTACSDKAEKPPYGGLKIGKPYEVYGRWYKPKYEADYDEIGKASWYGPGFHGGKTANGERFDQNALTAAHRTLPMPSIVRVTNLDNGRSTVVKVNDRGPFSHERILDLSKAAALKLDIVRSGTARVRVQFLEAETKEYVQNTYGKGVQFATNELKQVDPVEAGKLQDKKENVKFVPSGEAPPPDSVAVSGVVAVNYSKDNIFQAVDKNDAGSSSAPLAKYEAAADEGETAAPEPAPAHVQKVNYLDAGSPSTDHPLQTMGSYFVQLGTFGNKDNADRLASRVGTQYDAKVVSFTTASSHTLYRVVVGPYNQPETAKNMLSKLSAVGMADAKVIRN